MNDNIKVLVTRPLHQTSNICQLLSVHRIEPICFPTIYIEKLCSQPLPEVGKFDFFIFTSANAVLCAPSFFLHQLQHSSKRVILALGKATKEALIKIGFSDCHAPLTHMNSQGVLCYLQKYFKNIARKKFLIITGESGIDHLYQQLSLLDCKVENLYTYRRTMPQVHSYECLRDWMQATLSITMITSCNALENLLSIVKKPSRAFLLQNPIIVPSARIEEYAMQNQASNVWLANSALDEAMVNCLLANVQILIK